MNQTLGFMRYGLALTFSGGLMIGMFRLALPTAKTTV